MYDPSFTSHQLSTYFSHQFSLFSLLGCLSCFFSFTTFGCNTLFECTLDNGFVLSNYSSM